MCILSFDIFPIFFAEHWGHNDSSTIQLHCGDALSFQQCALDQFKSFQV